MSEETDKMDMGDSDITDDDKLWSLLSYIIPIVALIVLFLEDKKARPFIKHHAVNGLILGAIVVILSSISFLVVPGCIALLIWFYAIYLGVKAYNGEWVDVPFFTDFAKGQGWI